jgi:transcription initiation factor IIF auxiliary subunit
VSVRINNNSKPIEKRGDLQYYQWEIFVDEPPERLNDIESVEYVLHPTFPQPVQVRRDPKDKFALKTSGWGEFNIAVRVTFKDGKKEDLSYRLNLRKG